MQDEPQRARWTIIRLVWFALGALCVALAAVGVVIPVLPTTPFLIVAVWAFGKSSPAFAERLRRHPRLGPYIVDWEQHRVIPLYAKILACLMMGAAMAYLVFWSAAPWWAQTLAAALMAAAAVYILSKPSRAL